MALRQILGLLTFCVGYCMACSDNWKYFQGSCYKFETDEQSWDRARVTCERYRGYLVEISSQEENDFVKERLNKHMYHLDHHIGASDRDNEGDFRWYNSGTSLAGAYRNWGPGEPNQHRGNDEDCVEMRLNGWNDIPCSKRQYFVCERPGYI